MSMAAMVAERNAVVPTLEYAIALQNPTVADIKAAFERLYNRMLTDTSVFPWQKVRVRFAVPVPVRVNTRSMKTVSELHVWFFADVLGGLCYSVRIDGKNGFRIETFDYAKIVSLSIAPAQHDPVSVREREARGLLARRHPNAWHGLTADGDVRYLGLQTADVSKVFPPAVIAQVQSAFDGQQPYRFEVAIGQRVHRIETKLGQDGVFRAWYKHMHRSTGKGYLYRLLNPLLATFRIKS